MLHALHTLHIGMQSESGIGVSGELIYDGVGKVYTVVGRNEEGGMVCGLTAYIVTEGRLETSVGAEDTLGSAPNILNVMGEGLLEAHCGNKLAIHQDSFSIDGIKSFEYHLMTLASFVCSTAQVRVSIARGFRFPIPIQRDGLTTNASPFHPNIAHVLVCV